MLPLKPAAGATRRGDRRVRPHAALPGRRQLPGQPDPARRAAGRAARRPGRGVEVELRRGLRDRRRPSDDEALREEAVALAGDATTWWFPRSARGGGVRGLRPDPHRPARRTSCAWSSAGASWASRWSWCSPTARSSQLSTWEHHVAAVLECWLSGQAAGGAVADLLTGAANPSGKLAETIPLRLEDNPSYLNFPGDPAWCATARACSSATAPTTSAGQAVSYPFGFGLSYTTLRDLRRPRWRQRLGRRGRSFGRGQRHRHQHRDRWPAPRWSRST